MEETALQATLRKQNASFAPVVPFDPRSDRIAALDLSAGNSSISPEILSDTGRFTAWIRDFLETERARYAIGGYGELRELYRVSRVFNARYPGEEPRRFHLGMDIWGKPYTHVMAPLDGIVHSFGFNNNFGDYGATIILSHVLPGDLHFHSLYGHLSLNSIRNLQDGQTILKGDVFAEFGIPVENGHWPPHLHFQIIADMQGWKGDYPGVCKFSERQIFLRNCPDPDVILQMKRYLA